MKRILLFPVLFIFFSFVQGDSTSWFAGTWTGIGYQIRNPTTTWTMKFTADPRTGTYDIDYPSVPCKGHWSLVKSDEHVAEFKEKITENLDSCVDKGRVVLTKIDENFITFSYFYDKTNVLGSYCTLERSTGE